MFNVRAPELTGCGSLLRGNEQQGAVDGLSRLAVGRHNIGKGRKNERVAARGDHVARQSIGGIDGARLGKDPPPERGAAESLGKRAVDAADGKSRAPRSAPRLRSGPAQEGYHPAWRHPVIS